MCGNMVSSRKMTPWLMVVFCLVTADCSNVTDQQTSESQRDQVAILKQIRKVNEDGSYSFGYEAGDGSFKVESRDVLGNIKGTFGFVDANGEIKRVSYSSSNGTGFKATSVSPLQEQVSVVQSIPRVNRSSTTRKPTVTYATSTESSSSKSSSVVQAIPRLRKTTSTTTAPATTSSTNLPTESPRQIFNHHIKSTPKNRPRFVINGQQRPAPIEEETIEHSQITRPTIEEKAATYRRIIFAKRPVDHNLRPITEEFEEKEEEAKITTGNTLRRQLHEDTTKSELINDNVNDDQADVYSSGSLSTHRPLFTTTTTTTAAATTIPSRLIHRIPGIRTERPRTIYVNQNNFGPARFENNNKYESPRVYEEESKFVSNDREADEQILIKSRQTITNDNLEYQHRQQENEPVFVQQKPYLRQLFPGQLLIRRNNNQNDPSYGTEVPIGRILYRPHPSQQPLYATTNADNSDDYSSDTVISEPNENSHMPVTQNYVHSRNLARPLAYANQEIRRPRVMPRPIGQQPISQAIDDRDYPQSPVTPEYSYKSNSINLPPEPHNPIALPLSRRDFQILLRRLLVSQYGIDALSYPRTYLEDALYDQQRYPNYQPGYQAPLPRQALGYDEPSLPRRYGDRLSLIRHGYSRAINPLYQPHGYDDDYEDNRYAKRVYRQKFYTRQIDNDDGDEILPPAIRETLLLRMLQLAINSERPTMTTIMATTPTPTAMYRKNGPVRSVQIITDDDHHDDDESIRNKT